MTKLNLTEVFKINFEDHSLEVLAERVSVYIPAEYFEQNISEMIGVNVKTFGLFDILVEPEIGGPVHTIFFKCPTEVILCPDDIREERDKETKDLKLLLEFHKGSKFISTLNIQKDWRVGNKFFKLILNGYIPKRIPYNELISIWEDVTALSDLDLKINPEDHEIMLAELCRNPNNLKMLFRHYVNKHENVSMLDYKMMRISVVGKLNNTFSAISGGDPKQGITNSINRERYNEAQTISPAEIAIK